jgi:hypothetical protein
LSIVNFMVTGSNVSRRAAEGGSGDTGTATDYIKKERAGFSVPRGGKELFCFERPSVGKAIADAFPGLVCPRAASIVARCAE